MGVASPISAAPSDGQGWGHPSVVPTDVLQKAGGPGWTMWVGVAWGEPLSPQPPEALQGPVWLTQPFPWTAVGVEELRAWTLSGRSRHGHHPGSPLPRPTSALETASLPALESLGPTCFLVTS